ncbi:unnamed protein product [Schistosoma margrebowiei]|uniref:Uncharacterized protein n=1 Tax=Schistosoma margrebowiei TaxID=48269 RepID=A0A183N0M4_9TREM|nr:unnamed protein product [Schistosoma margrebowiei]
MVVGDSRQKTLEPGSVLLGTRHQGVPVPPEEPFHGVGNRKVITDFIPLTALKTTVYIYNIKRRKSECLDLNLCWCIQKIYLDRNFLAYDKMLMYMTDHSSLVLKEFCCPDLLTLVDSVTSTVRNIYDNRSSTPPGFNGCKIDVKQLIQTNCMHLSRT